MADRDYSRLEAALNAAGWRFDAQRERFSDGDRRVDYRRVLELIPGLSLDDLANYVTQQHEQWLLNNPPDDE